MSKMEESQVFKKRLEHNRPLVGTFVKIFSAETIEVLGFAGFDFIVIDMEHTTLAFHHVEQMVRTADLHGMSSIVRIPDASRSSILRALDLGAAGIQVPQLYNADEIREIVDKSKYPPQGSRGVTFAHRAARFGFTPADFLEKANEQNTVVIHIETESAYENLEELCRVEGVDVVFIGPVDLSICLGVNADYMNGELAAPVQRILDVCRENGVKTGIAVTNEEQYRFAVQHEIPYIVWSSDVALFKQSVNGIVNIFKGEL